MDLLYVEMCVESSFKGVVRLVLDAWCGYGEFLFNLQLCGYLWRGMKSQCMVRLLQCMVRFSDAVMLSLTFLVWPTSVPKHGLILLENSSPRITPKHSLIPF